MLCATAALAAAGCGGDDEEESGGAGATTEQPAAPQTDTGSGGGATDTAAAGREIFTTSCGGCHTLEAAGTSGQTGPNLDELKPDADRVRAAISEGPGIMPENLVEGPEADQVAEFVATSAGG